jgi:hypothetical protein
MEDPNEHCALPSFCMYFCGTAITARNGFIIFKRNGHDNRKIKRKREGGAQSTEGPCSGSGWRLENRIDKAKFTFYYRAT